MLTGEVTARSSHACTAIATDGDNLRLSPRALRRIFTLGPARHQLLDEGDTHA